MSKKKTRKRYTDKQPFRGIGGVKKTADNGSPYLELTQDGPRVEVPGVSVEVDDGGIFGATLITTDDGGPSSLMADGVPSHIGPPADLLLDFIKRHYDTVSYADTDPMAGIPPMMEGSSYGPGRPTVKLKDIYHHALDALDHHDEHAGGCEPVESARCPACERAREVIHRIEHALPILDGCPFAVVNAALSLLVAGMRSGQLLALTQEDAARYGRVSAKQSRKNRAKRKEQGEKVAGLVPTHGVVGAALAVAGAEPDAEKTVRRNRAERAYRETVSPKSRCDYCGDPIPEPKTNKKYCSATCRSSAHNKKRRTK